MKSLFAVEPGSETAFEQLPDSLPAPFERIELPGELPDVAAIRNGLFKPVRGHSLGVADVVAPELARRVAEADLPVRLEFMRLFRERCRRASELRVSELTADFDFSRAVAEPEYGRRLRSLLRGCYGILEEFRMTLRFPVRIDFAAGEDAARYVRQLRDLLYPRLGLALEVDLEEPFPEGSRLPEALRFHSSYWRLRCAEPLEYASFRAFAPEDSDGNSTVPRRLVFVPSGPPDRLRLAELAAQLEGGAPEVIQRELFFDGAGSGAGIA